MQLKYWILPFVSAVVGWFTNFVAVKMIFHPREEIRLFGLSIQGLLPKRRGELALSIGRIVDEELISHHDIRNAVGSEMFQNHAAELISRRVEEFVDQRALPFRFLLRGSIARRLIRRVKDALTKEIISFLPEFSQEMMAEIEEKVDFGNIVVERIEGFDMDRLERVVFKVAEKELKYIELLGGVLGFVIGLVQLLLLWIF